MIARFSVSLQRLQDLAKVPGLNKIDVAPGVSKPRTKDEYRESVSRQEPLWDHLLTTPAHLRGTS
jgi:hypothetical protein